MKKNIITSIPTYGDEFKTVLMAILQECLGDNLSSSSEFHGLRPMPYIAVSDW